MFRDGSHLLRYVTIDVFKAVPGREGAPDFVRPDATAESNACLKDAFSCQLAGKAMGRMSIEFLIQRVDFGRSETSEYLDESPCNRRDIDFFSRIRFVEKKSRLLLPRHRRRLGPPLF